MSQLKKQIISQPHRGALYLVDGKHKTASSPSSGSENDQDRWFGINEKALLRRLDLRLLLSLTLLCLLLISVLCPTSGAGVLTLKDPPACPRTHSVQFY